MIKGVKSYPVNEDAYRSMQTMLDLLALHEFPQWSACFQEYVPINVDPKKINTDRITQYLTGWAYQRHNLHLSAKGIIFRKLLTIYIEEQQPFVHSRIFNDICEWTSTTVQSVGTQSQCYPFIYSARISCQRFFSISPCYLIEKQCNEINKSTGCAIETRKRFLGSADRVSVFNW